MFQCQSMRELSACLGGVGELAPNSTMKFNLIIFFHWPNIYCRAMFFTLVIRFSVKFRVPPWDHSQSVSQMLFNHSHTRCFRYVNNRLWIGPRSVRRAALDPYFWRLDFYTPPISLETVDGYDALGFNIDPLQRTVTSVHGVIRASIGAGPQSHVLPGLMSRVRLILSNTWSTELQLPQIQDLLAIHVHRDPIYVQCIPHIVQLARRHGHNWNTAQVSQYITY